MNVLQLSLVKRYLARKQYLPAASRLIDVVQVTRNILALHATDATGPSAVQEISQIVPESEVPGDD